MLRTTTKNPAWCLCLSACLWGYNRRWLPNQTNRQKVWSGTRTHAARRRSGRWRRTLRGQEGCVDEEGGCSSNGRAPASHAGGTGIDTLLLHLHFEASFQNYCLSKTKWLFWLFDWIGPIWHIRDASMMYIPGWRNWQRARLLTGRLWVRVSLWELFLEGSLTVILVCYLYTEKINIAPAQGWHAHIDNVPLFFLFRRKQTHASLIISFLP